MRLQTHLQCWYFHPTGCRADRSGHLQIYYYKVIIEDQCWPVLIFLHVEFNLFFRCFSELAHDFFRSRKENVKYKDKKDDIVLSLAWSQCLCDSALKKKRLHLETQNLFWLLKTKAYQFYQVIKQSYWQYTNIMR